MKASTEGNTGARMRRWRRIGLVLSLPLALFLLREGMVRHAEDRWRESLDKARAAGYPVSSNEFVEWCDAHMEGPEIAETFRAAAGRSNLSLLASAKPADPLPFLHGQNRPSLTGAAVSPDQKVLAESLLAANVDVLSRLKDLFHQFRPPYVWRNPSGLDTMPFPLAEIEAPLRLLQLETLMQADRGNAEEAFRALNALFGYAESLRTNALWQKEYRVAFEQAVITLESALNRCAFSEEQLVRFKEYIDGRLDGQMTKRSGVGAVAQWLSHNQRPPDYGSYGSARVTDRFSEERRMSESVGIWEAAFGLAYSHAGLYLLDRSLQLEILLKKISAEARYKGGDSPIDYDLPQVPWYCPEADRFKRSIESIVLAGGRDLSAVTARTVIAVERYRLQNGKLPETLDALVPEYLKSTPLDAFDRKPLKYRVIEQGYIVYSIGHDRIDDGGYGYLGVGAAPANLPEAPRPGARDMAFSVLRHPEKAAGSS